MPPLKKLSHRYNLVNQFMQWHGAGLLQTRLFLALLVLFSNATAPSCYYAFLRRAATH